MAYAEFIDGCLRQAAELARTSFDRSCIAVKPDDPNQLVTATDLAISAMLTSRIGETFPHHSIVDEESGVRRCSDTTWILDPLDGSSNYAAGTALYGTMMAVAEGGKIIAAGVVLPEFDEYLLAESGQGAHLNGVALRAPAHTRLADSLIAYGLDLGSAEEMAEDWTRLAWLARHCAGIRMSNSVFDAVQVIKGAYGAFLHRHTRIWDVAALSCLAEEAGARCTDLVGRPLDFAAPLASADAWYPVLLHTTTAVGPELGLP